MLSFKIIGYLILEKLFEGFYYEHGGHLGHVTRPIFTNIFVLPMDAPLEIWLSLVG